MTPKDKDRTLQRKLKKFKNSWQSYPTQGICIFYIFFYIIHKNL